MQKVQKQKVPSYWDVGNHAFVDLSTFEKAASGQGGSANL